MTTRFFVGTFPLTVAVCVTLGKTKDWLASLLDAHTPLLEALARTGISLMHFPQRPQMAGSATPAALIAAASGRPPQSPRRFPFGHRGIRPA